MFVMGREFRIENLTPVRQSDATQNCVSNSNGQLDNHIAHLNANVLCALKV